MNNLHNPSFWTVIREHFMKLPTAAKLFVAVVILPTVLCSIYYGLIASDIYIAEAKYSLRISSENASSGLFETILGGGSTIESTSEDASIVRDYILSREMINVLESELNLRAHYGSDHVDLLSRFDTDDSLEDFLQYYRHKVEAGIDPTTNISTLRVRAFDPEMARDIAQTIINQSEQLVNSISSRMVEDSLQFSRAEVAAAEARVRAASAALTRFRGETNSINPGEETKAVLGIITELETQLAAARAQLIEAASYMQDDSTQVQVLRGKVKALEQQVLEERKRLSSDEKDSSTFTSLIDSYQPLMLEQEMATKQYASSLASLELARIEAQKKQRYLLPFVPPRIPDAATEPRRTRIVLTIFIGLCLVYAIGGLAWAAIKDHMRI